MAKIHGISGSTRYVLKGIKPINGKQLATFEEINHFYTNYDTVLAGINEHAGKRQDKLVADLHAKELQLDQQIKDGIAQKTIEVNQRILEINKKIDASQNFFLRTIHIAQFWGASYLSSYRINRPFYEDLSKLEQIRYHRKYSIANREQIIQNERMNVIHNHKFLKENETFLIGARGEEQVVNVLTGLPDEYHVLNDINLVFNKYIYWRERKEHIKTCQIDHLVVGPTGIFLLETKNWKISDIGTKFDDLKHQVRRAGYALWYFMKDDYWRKMPKVRSVVVSMHGSLPDQRIDKYIDVISPHRLCDYIADRERILSEDAIHKLIRIIPCRETN
ncbi:MAG: nuclease-related domain-containing protein [Methanoregula sp.]